MTFLHHLEPHGATVRASGVVPAFKNPGSNALLGGPRQAPQQAQRWHPLWQLPVSACTWFNASTLRCQCRTGVSLQQLSNLLGWSHRDEDMEDMDELMFVEATTP
eukprot:2065820-Amphidinium_carterae.1